MKRDRAQRFQRTTDTFVPGAKTLAQRYFVSPEILAEEQGKIFSNHWLLIGHQSQIPKPGDYFLVEVCGESVIVICSSRQQMDSRVGGSPRISGFYNVCRHRGTRLKEEACGHVSTIQCPYHAWTYGLDGRLVGAPHMEEAEGFHRADYALHSVNTGLFEGFIFVNLAVNPEPLAEWFAPLEGKFSHWNLPNLRSAKRIWYDVRANWKLIFENYSECYHCPGVHPMLSKISPYDSAENDLVEGPFLGGFMRINQGRSLTMSGNACALAVDYSEGRPQDDEEGARVFYYSIFPNMLLSLHPDYVMVHQVWPLAPERSVICCDWLFHPEAFGTPAFNPEDAIAFWDLTNKQDWHVCELSQKGIGSRAYRPGPYTPRESIPAAWDQEYLNRMKPAAR